MNDFALVILSGFSIGILGSFHCVGMCGPLALALPVDKASNKTSAILLYNLGRALSYTGIGVLFGLLGQSFELFQLQQWLTITAGVIILGLLLISKLSNTRFFPRFTNQIKSKLSHYLQSEKTLISYLNIGALNGLLPCGLVYMAIAASLATGDIFKGGVLMLAFGLGTLPVMALTMAFGRFISFSWRSRLQKLTPYVIAGVAMLLILRGLNLGIPYVSPAQEKGEISCCKK